ncbi:MAG TPA: hypothetical protein VF486_27390 [Actinomycetes bacterium]
MPPDPRAVARRDAGLHRVSRLTRWLVAGSLALTGLFAGLAARAFPGHSQQASATTTTTTTVTSSQSDDSSSQDDGSDQLQAPAAAPSASGGSGSVTSGGS